MKASERFDDIAVRFAQSEVHRSSPTMQRLQQMLGLSLHGQTVCDVACGAGHLGLSLDQYARQLVAVDPAPRMLEQCRLLARGAGVTVQAVTANAEALPFPDASFDVVVSRLAPHHFGDIHLALDEMARVTSVGGHVGIIDLEGDEDEEVDEFNHRLEVLHDPTHVRSYRPSEWAAAFQEADLGVVALESSQRESAAGISVARWCEIAASGIGAENRIRAALDSAPQRFLNALLIDKRSDDYYIPVKTVLIVGVRRV